MQRNRDSWKRVKGSRVDAKFVDMNGSEYYVVLGSKRLQHDDYVEHQEDLTKLGRHLRDMLWALHERRPQIVSNEKIRILGSLTSINGWSTWSLSHKGYTALLYQVGDFEVPIGKEDISQLLNILRFTAQLQKHLQTEVEELETTILPFRTITRTVRTRLK